MNVFQKIKSNPKLLKLAEQNREVAIQDFSREEMVPLVTRPVQMPECIFITFLLSYDCSRYTKSVNIIKQTGEMPNVQLIKNAMSWNVVI